MPVRQAGSQPCARLHNFLFSHQALANKVSAFRPNIQMIKRQNMGKAYKANIAKRTTVLWLNAFARSTALFHIECFKLIHNLQFDHQYLQKRRLLELARFCRTRNLCPNQTHMLQSLCLQHQEPLQFKSRSKSFNRLQNIDQTSAGFGLVTTLTNTLL